MGCGEWKFVQMFQVTWPRFWNQEADDLETWYTASGTRVLPMVSYDDLWPWPFLWQDAGIAQSVEALFLTTKLYTSSVRVQIQPGTKYLYGKKNSMGMYLVWLSASSHVGFTGISWECRDMSWFSSTSGSPAHNTQQWGWHSNEYL